MRILCLSHSGGIGGAERCLAEAFDSLAERGHHLHVVLPEEGPLRQFATAAESVEVCWSNRWVTGPFPPPLVRCRWLAYNALNASRTIADLARRVGADLILTNTLLMPAGAFAARRAGLPHVWFLHEYGIEDHGLRFHFGRRPTLALMSRLTDVFLVNSEALERHFSRWLPAERLRHVHYAVDVPNDVPSNKDGGTFRLVLAGHLHHGKGQHDAITAVGHLKREGFDVKLDVIGSGSSEYERQLRDLASETGVADRVHFVEFRQGHLGLVARADAALMCSRSEALGRVTVEAMKLGLPVVGAAAGATPELVRDGWNGLLYEPGDAEALSESVKRLYNDRTECVAMGRRGRDWAMQTFNRRVYGSELEDALETAAAAQR